MVSTGMLVYSIRKMELWPCPSTSWVPLAVASYGYLRRFKSDYNGYKGIVGVLNEQNGTWNKGRY